MTMSKELAAAFNDQINLEFASSFAYLAMAAWCEDADLVGFAQWLRAQAAEEHEHAMKFFEFLIDRDVRVRLQPLDAPESDFGSPLQVMESALAHEQRVTAAISALYAAATEEQDFASLPLLNWFVSEQVEEEATVRQIVAELKMVGDDSSALLLLDRDMAARRGGTDVDSDD